MKFCANRWSYISICIPILYHNLYKLLEYWYSRPVAVLLYGAEPYFSIIFSSSLHLGFSSSRITTLWVRGDVEHGNQLDMPILGPQCVKCLSLAWWLANLLGFCYLDTPVHLQWVNSGLYNAAMTPAEHLSEVLLLVSRKKKEKLF